MNKIFKIIYINIIINIILIVNRVFAGNENVINILINRPDVNPEEYIYKYNSLINQYFLDNKLKNNLDIPDVVINFSYCIEDENRTNSYIKNMTSIYPDPNILINKQYVKYISCTIDELKQSNYDMMILGDNFLFSDDAYASFSIFKLTYNYVNLYELYQNLDNYINETDISFHKKEFLDGGHFRDKGLLALPYEVDYDILFYHYYLNNFTDFIESGSAFQNSMLNSNADTDTNSTLNANTNSTISHKRSVEYLYDNLYSNGYDDNFDYLNSKFITDNESSSSNTSDPKTRIETNNANRNSIQNNNRIYNEDNNNADMNLGSNKNKNSNGTTNSNKNNKNNATSNKNTTNNKSNNAKSKKNNTPANNNASNTINNKNSSNNNNNNNDKVNDENDNHEKEVLLSLLSYNVTDINELSKYFNENTTEYQTLMDNGLISVGLGNNFELLNIFTEYIRYNKYIPYDEKSIFFFNFLWNDEKLKKQFYEKFREHIIHSTGKNINENLLVSTEEAYQKFIKKEKLFLRGKTSYYQYFKNQNITVSYKGLPDDISVLNKKYLVINKNTKKDIKTLVNVALQLTSEEMQLYRLNHFSTIPTFDLNEYHSEGFNAYCQINSDFCHLIKKIKSFDITKIFTRYQYSGNFMETNLIVPSYLNDYLKTNNYTNTNIKLTNILNTYLYSLSEMYKLDCHLLIQDIITTTVLIVLVIVIFLVYLNRKHPYLKAISPFLSILTIIGMTMNIAITKLMLYSHNELMCRLIYILKYFVLNLVYLPMFAIIFRIYYIYTNISKVNFGKKLNDKRIFHIISISLTAILLVTIAIVCSDDIHITSMGTVNKTRMFMCYYVHYKYYITFSYLYSFVMFIAMIIMTVKTIKVSKKFGEVKYILFIVVLLFSSMLSEGHYIILSMMGKDSYYYLILHVIYIIFCLGCVYLLVGYRLIYIKKHPIKNGTYKGNDINNDYFNTTINIVDFIPLKKELIKNYPFFNRSKSNNEQGTFFVVKDDHQNEPIDPSDPIANNPNNYFFNQALKKMENEKPIQPWEYNRRGC